MFFSPQNQLALARGMEPFSYFHLAFGRVSLTMFHFLLLTISFCNWSSSHYKACSLIFFDILKEVITVELECL